MEILQIFSEITENYSLVCISSEPGTQKILHAESQNREKI